MTPEVDAESGRGVCQVVDASGQHVGNLKWIRGAWKFKAIGYDASGAVIPGGGPLTDRHNTVVASLDPVQVGNALGCNVVVR